MGLIMHGEGVRHPTTSVKRKGYLPSSVPLSLLNMVVVLT